MPDVIRPSLYRSADDGPDDEDGLVPTALGHGDQALALRLLAGQFSGAPDRFGFLAVAALGGLFISAVLPHFAENAFALHFLLQDLEGLVDIVVSDENLHVMLVRWLFYEELGRARYLFTPKLIAVFRNARFDGRTAQAAGRGLIGSNHADTDPRCKFFRKPFTCRIGGERIQRVILARPKHEEMKVGRH
jgi:hypothetical protein